MSSVNGRVAAPIRGRPSMIFWSAASPPRPDARCASQARTVLKVVNGKIVEEIGLDDGVTALSQLGLIKAA